MIQEYVADPSRVVQSDNDQVKNNLVVETMSLRIDGRRLRKAEELIDRISESSIRRTR
ncbi:hypothetical protein A2U01_0055492, partial [Trifolium medium]|nr:hypothetical protein [Trifolium medium]